VINTSTLTGGSAVAMSRSPNGKSAQDVQRALDLVQKWVEEHDYRGYEPFDGLSSWARPLALGNQLA
jgi:hypothetical protein